MKVTGGWKDEPLFEDCWFESKCGVSTSRLADVNWVCMMWRTDRDRGAEFACPHIGAVILFRWRAGRKCSTPATTQKAEVQSWEGPSMFFFHHGLHQLVKVTDHIDRCFFVASGGRLWERFARSGHQCSTLPCFSSFEGSKVFRYMHPSKICCAGLFQHTSFLFRSCSTQNRPFTSQDCEADMPCGVAVNSLTDSFKWHYHLLDSIREMHGEGPLNQLVENLQNATWFSQYSSLDQCGTCYIPSFFTGLLLGVAFQTLVFFATTTLQRVNDCNGRFDMTESKKEVTGSTQLLKKWEKTRTRKDPRPPSENPPWPTTMNRFLKTNGFPFVQVPCPAIQSTFPFMTLTSTIE